MTQPDYLQLIVEPLFAMLLALPGQFIEAAREDPRLWLIPAGFVALAIIRTRPRRSRRRRRPQW
jgi:hypothetical protein